jgi:hypothetical protein
LFNPRRRIFSAVETAAETARSLPSHTLLQTREGGFCTLASRDFSRRADLYYKPAKAGFVHLRAVTSVPGLIYYKPAKAGFVHFQAVTSVAGLIFSFPRQ